MPGGQADLLQAVLQPLAVVQVGLGQRGHADDGVHGRADVVAHGGEELALGPAGLLRLFQRPLQRLLVAALPLHRVGQIRARQAHAAQPQVDGGDGQALGAHAAALVPDGIGERIGICVLQALQYGGGLHHLRQERPVGLHHGLLPHPAAVFRKAGAAVHHVRSGHGDHVLHIGIQIHVGHAVAAEHGQPVQNLFRYNSLRHVGHRQYAHHISAIGILHRIDGELGVPAPRIPGQLHEAAPDDLPPTPGVGLQNRRVEEVPQKRLALRRVGDHRRQRPIEALSARTNGRGEPGARVIHQLLHRVAADVAVAHEQHVRPHTAVMAADPVAVLSAQPLPLRDLARHVLIHDVDPAAAVAAVQHRHGAAHRHVSAPAAFQPVDQRGRLPLAGEERAQLAAQHLPVVRMHAGHGICAVQLPGLIQRHARHGGEALRYELRLRMPVRIVADHRHTGGDLVEDVLLRVIGVPLPGQLLHQLPALALLPLALVDRPVEGQHGHLAPGQVGHADVVDGHPVVFAVVAQLSGLHDDLPLAAGHRIQHAPPGKPPDELVPVVRVHGGRAHADQLVYGARLLRLPGHELVVFHHVIAVARQVQRYDHRIERLHALDDPPSLVQQSRVRIGRDVDADGEQQRGLALTPHHAADGHVHVPAGGPVIEHGAVGIPALDGVQQAAEALLRADLRVRAAGPEQRPNRRHGGVAIQLPAAVRRADADARLLQVLKRLHVHVLAHGFPSFPFPPDAPAMCQSVPAALWSPQTQQPPRLSAFAR